ncbi:hypothetical protein [Bosea vaviloviae]|uniref:Phage tail lysozyme domain-containing protein n=1 Tax=Bosea vaviloviae TaxID=1526658 RepID=A0A1D7U2U4_9HYPH|nr:hypothetical protein [Bosea vaviloviae]AOO81662.1 hypothetical protein BHK69_15445 [Bosea vaviloviae]
MAQPWNLGPPVVDFSPLSQLGEAYNSALDQSRKRQGLANLGQGLDGSPEGYLKAARGLFAAGDARGAANFLALSEKARARTQTSDEEASSLIAPGPAVADEPQAALAPATPSVPAQRAFNRPVQLAETEADTQRLEAEMEQRNRFGYGNPALPAGMRNNNPGNIKYAGNTAFPGVVGPSRNTDQGDPQSVFNSPEAGMSAAYGLALRKYQGGKRTADELIAGRNGWTPGNSAAAANIARAMGLAPDQDLELANPQRARAFMQALIAQEHGAAGARYPADMIRSAVNGGLGAGQPGQGQEQGPRAQPQAREGSRARMPDGTIITLRNNQWEPE